MSALGVNLHFRFVRREETAILHELSLLTSEADTADQVTVQCMFLSPVPTTHTFHRCIGSGLSLDRT